MTERPEKNTMGESAPRESAAGKSGGAAFLAFFTRSERIARALLEKCLSARMKRHGKEAALLEEFAALARTAGEGDFIAQIQARIPDGMRRAHFLAHLARPVLTVNLPVSIATARESARLDPRPFRRKWLAFFLFDAGKLAEPDDILSRLLHKPGPGGAPFTPAETAKARRIKGYSRLLEAPDTFFSEMMPSPSFSPAFSLPAKPAPDEAGERAGRVLYLAASALPYHVSGYTVRTQQIAHALRAQGWDVTVATRPGYPADRKDRLCAPSAGPVCHEEGVPYLRLDGAGRHDADFAAYAAGAAEHIASAAAQTGAGIIHAASNYESALPGLIAARRLGLPFIYEVRGLWEWTSAARMPGWEETERFALDKTLESLLAAEADHVLTLGPALAEELARRGTAREKITLMPNAVDTETFAPRPFAAELAKRLGIREGGFVAGYVGSLVGYEGLDDLIRAFALLKRQEPAAQLLIVGDGPPLPDLRAQAIATGHGADIIFTGRVPPGAAPAYLSLLSVMALPRKDLPVCHLVTPLKPYEAMAMGVPLVVSSVRALSDIAGNGERGLVFPAGDVEGLAQALLGLARDPLRRRVLAEAARRHVEENHRWDTVTQPVSALYRSLRSPAVTPACPDGAELPHARKRSS